MERRWGLPVRSGRVTGSDVSGVGVGWIGGVGLASTNEGPSRTLKGVGVKLGLLNWKRVKSAREKA